MTKYIIKAKDKTVKGYPMRIWIYDDEYEARINMRFLCDNPDWSLPQMFQVDEVIYNGEFLR